MLPFDAECYKHHGKNLHDQNELTEFVIEAKHLTKKTNLSLNEKSQTSSPMLPNYS